MIERCKNVQKELSLKEYSLVVFYLRHTDTGLILLFSKIINVNDHFVFFSKVAQITFNLWYRLSEILYQKNCDGLNAVFRPHIERLIGALCRHCQMEPDHVGI